MEILDLYKKSDRTLRFTIREIPASRTVSSAKWMLKKLPADADVDALIEVAGTVTDSGSDGTAGVDVDISETDCDGLDSFETTRKTYVAALKLFLDNGAAVLVPGTIQTVRIRDHYVAATS